MHRYANDRLRSAALPNGPFGVHVDKAIVITNRSVDPFYKEDVTGWDYEELLDRLSDAGVVTGLDHNEHCLVHLFTAYNLEGGVQVGELADNIPHRISAFAEHLGAVLQSDARSLCMLSLSKTPCTHARAHTHTHTHTPVVQCMALTLARLPLPPPLVLSGPLMGCSSRCCRVRAGSAKRLSHRLFWDMCGVQLHSRLCVLQHSVHDRVHSILYSSSVRLSVLLIPFLSFHPTPRCLFVSD